MLCLLVCLCRLQITVGSRGSSTSVLPVVVKNLSVAPAPFITTRPPETRSCPLRENQAVPTQRYFVVVWWYGDETRVCTSRLTPRAHTLALSHSVPALTLSTKSTPTYGRVYQNVRRLLAGIPPIRTLMRLSLSLSLSEITTAITSPYAVCRICEAACFSTRRTRNPTYSQLSHGAFLVRLIRWVQNACF